MDLCLSHIIIIIANFISAINPKTQTVPSIKKTLKSKKQNVPKIQVDKFSLRAKTKSNPIMTDMKRRQSCIRREIIVEGEFCKFSKRLARGDN
jgi:hypothetical protein